MTRKSGILVITGVSLFFGCQSARYEPGAKFVNSYADLKLVSTALSHDPERAGEMRRVILARHGMTPAEFHEQFMRLAENPEAWKPFQERVLARIDEFQANREQRKEGENVR